VGGGAAAREKPVSTRTLVLLATLGGAAVAIVAVLLLPVPSARAPAPARAIAVRAAFSPAAVESGDTVAARIVVTMDEHAVRPSSLNVVYGVAPLTQLGRAVEHHATRGGASVTTIDVRAACLTDSCLAATGRRGVAPRAVRADVARRDDAGRASATAAWVPLVISGRVAPADLAQAQPPFRADTTPPSPSYRIRPSTLAVLLDGLAVLLAACAAGVAAAALLRARRPRQEAAQDELDHALLLARAARTRPERDRRTAAGYVARLLARRGAPLAHTADELAWSRPAPTPDSLTELVEGVEQERPA
jgi:hypothetical protein